MNKSRFLLVGAVSLAAALTVVAQAPPPPPGGPGEMGRFGGPFHMLGGGRQVVTGAPFSAEFSNSSIETLADGNTITRSTGGHTARDSQGRTYFQETLQGGPLVANGAVTLTFITDPVAGYEYVLNSNTKVAHRHAFHPRAGEGPKGPDAQGDRPPRPDAGEHVESDLGQQNVGGVTAQGKSITHTIPAGAIGNSQPLVSKHEIWTSPDLKIVVLAKRSDPRMGQSTYALSNVRRGEPAASLFQVPSDYTVQDGPAFGGRHGGPGPGAPK